MRAQKAQAKAAKVGFDWPTVDEVQAKIREEIAEVEAETTGGPGHNADAVADEIGDLMFATVNLARWHKLDAERRSTAPRTSSCGGSSASKTALRAMGRRWEDGDVRGVGRALGAGQKIDPAADDSVNETGQGKV